MIRVHIIEIGRFKSKMTVLQNNYRKMTILFQDYSHINALGIKFDLAIK